MIIHKGVHMKRLIALLIVVAFCISIFAAPASAACPNPNDLRLVRGETPYGDEHPWNDDDSEVEWITQIRFIKLLFSKHPMVWFIVKPVGQNNSEEINERPNSSDTQRSRSTSSE